MGSLITDKSKEYLSMMTSRQAEIKEKEAKLEVKGEKDPKLAWDLMIDSLNAISYPVAAFNLFYAYQLPTPESWFNHIRSLWVKMLYFGEIALLPYLDTSFSEIEENLSLLGAIPIQERLLWLEKAGLLMNYAETFSAMHSKMSFAWIDLMARLSILIKNSVNYSEVYPALALTHPDHEAMSVMVFSVTNALSMTAESLRKRYELKNHEGDDLEKALIYLNVLKQVLSIGSSSEEIDKVQKKHDVWQAKLNSDRRKTKNESEASS